MTICVADYTSMLNFVIGNGLEGVVAKRAEGKYLPGRPQHLRKERRALSQRLLALHHRAPQPTGRNRAGAPQSQAARVRTDRKSTRLNSSHLGISYAVFCLKKKKDKFYMNFFLHIIILSSLLIKLYTFF